MPLDQHIKRNQLISELGKLQTAYLAMKALDTTDPNDPRGFRRQANVHCLTCAARLTVYAEGDSV
jgi:hypothetical protein